MEFSTGYVGKNKEGLEYEVLDGSLSKKTVIKFLVDGAEVVTTKAYLKVGLPIHPTYNRLVIGKVFKDREGNEFRLIEKVKDAVWKIKFLKDGVECIRENKAIKAGTVKHPTDGIPVVGETYNVKRGKIKVLNLVDSNHVEVEFEDGVKTITTSSDIRKGYVAHPLSDLHIGQRFTTNSGWNGEVIGYESPHKVLVKWQDGSSEYHPAGHIKNGGIKPLYQPSVTGVGYFGEGRFSSESKKGKESAPKEILAYWKRMLNRCFNPKEVLKDSSRGYIFVNVHKDWFCFQNFAEWALSQPNWNLGFDLDKDLIGDSLEYAPEKCTFLPSDINSFLSEQWAKEVHKLPAGVQYIKPATKGAKEGYVARCHTNNGREYLGYFDDPDSAHTAYKKRKEEYAKFLVEKYKQVITQQAYNNLLKYEVPKYFSKEVFNCST